MSDSKPTPRGMLTNLERTFTQPADTVRVTCFRNFLPVAWTPPIWDWVSTYFTVPTYNRRYERLRTYKRNIDIFKGGSDFHRSTFLKRWKPCQRYIRYTEQPKPEEAYRSGIVWGSLVITEHGAYISRPQQRVPALLVADSPVFRDKFGVFGDHINGLTSMTVSDADGGFVPKPAGLNVLVEHALKSMLPSVKQDMSLLNTLIELRDFKSLPRTLRNINAVIHKIDSMKLVRSTNKLIWSTKWKGLGDKKDTLVRRRYLKVRKSFKFADGPTLREIFQSSADGYLQMEFNIKPLLRDIAALYEALVGVDKRIKRLLNESGRTHMKHYSFEWQEFLNLPENLQSTNTYSLNLGQFAGTQGEPGTTPAYKAHVLSWKATRRVTNYQPTTFHAQAEYWYNFTQFQLENTQVLRMLDSMGLSLLNPSIIWNAIPWSFLVDWVLGVSQWLKGRTVLNMTPTIGISRFLWSWERHRRISVTVETVSKGYGVPTTIETYLPTMYESTYRRDVELPVRTNSSIFGSGLNSKELSLGVALAITSRKRSTSRDS